MKKRCLVFSFIFLFVFVSLFPFISSELEDGLVAYWNFDETNGDLIDRYDAFEGSLNGIFQGYSGIINNSYYFDGIGDYVEIEKRIQLYEEASFSFWIKPEIYDKKGNTIISKRTGEGYYGLEDDWQIGFQNDTLYATFWQTENPYHSIPFSLVDEWTYVVITYDGVNVRIYLDGIIVYEAPNSGYIKNGDYETRIGDDFWDSFYKGQIDEMGIWERALSDEEIYELYNNGEGLPYSGEYSPTVEERVSFLEYVQELVLDKLSEIIDILETHSEELKDHSEELEDIGSKLDVCENKVNVLEDKIDEIENNPPVAAPSPYFKYLSLTDRKAVVCGYAIENKLKNYSDLGLNCTITYRTFSTGKVTTTCKCLLL